MPQTGKVGKTEKGIVDLASHNYDAVQYDPGSLPYTMHTETSQVWWTADANTTTNIIAGTIIGVAE